MNKLNFPGVKAAHQKEAIERKAVSDAMTPEQRLAYLDKCGFVAKRERERLAKKIEEVRATLARAKVKKGEKKEAGE